MWFITLTRPNTEGWERAAYAGSGDGIAYFQGGLTPSTVHEIQIYSINVILKWFNVQ